MANMEVLLDIYPENLLPENRELLSYNFEETREASASERQYWIAQMETATYGAEHVRNRADQTICSCHDAHSSCSTHVPLVVGINEHGIIQLGRDY